MNTPPNRYKMDITTLMNWTKRSSSPWVPNYTLIHIPVSYLLTTKNDKIVMSSVLAKVLGFSQNTFEAEKMLLRNSPTRSSKIYTADEPHGLAVHPEVYIHLAELSTSENLTNGQPRTLLRSIPVENEKRGAGRTILFQVLQYKRLAAGPISLLTIALRDTKEKRLPFDYLSATLYIRNG